MNPMAMITNLNNSGPREASFASYLSSNDLEEKIVAIKLSEPSNKIRSLDNQHHNYLKKKKQQEDDGEIDVFGAEKYFNGRIDEEAPPTPPSLDSPRKFRYIKSEVVELDQVKPKSSQSHYGTPSIRSESSWNSQNALLRSIMMRDTSSQRKTNKVQGKSFLSSICCKCSCSGGNSIEVVEDEQIGEISFKTSAQGSKIKIGKPIKEETNIPYQQQEETNQLQRKSLEVFGSPGAWDADFCQVNCDDTESHGSSDLFELDSITGKENQFLSHGYAPSEASIDWSVVTASAADYSIMSDSEDLRSAVTRAPSPLRTFYHHASNGKTGKNREMQKRRSTSLLGCKSQKAVMVAGDVYSRTTDPAGGTTRFGAETKHSGFESRQRQQVVGTGSFSRSHTSRASAPQLLLI